MPVSDPVPPFDATVAGAIALLPQASFPEESQLLVGQKGLTQNDILGFVEDVTGRVLARISGWTDLPDELQAVVVKAGRDVVHNGAASYTQAARFPEQADKESDTYAEVLWSRYEEGLEQLEQQVAGWIDDETPGHGSGDAGPIGMFPAATITEETRF